MNDTGSLAVGGASQPPDMAFYKRAVMRPAPGYFTVEVLPPTKQGNAHSYGLRILPAIRETETFSDAMSTISNHPEYEIWRRWEDILDFESNLAREFDRMSREKRRLLESAKQRKKTNGVYSSARNASSFESLPEGPDPKSVTFDVHKYLPKLTNKMTLFRISDATIRLRGQEFAALIDALFKPEQIQLVCDLRRCPAIRDFFGWWRRDKDLAAKNRPKFSNRSSTLDSSFRVPLTPVSPASSDAPPAPPLKDDPTSPSSLLSPLATTPTSVRPSSAMSNATDADRHTPSLLVSSDIDSRQPRARTPQPADIATRPRTPLLTPLQPSESRQPTTVQTNIHIERSYSPIATHSPGRQRATPPRSVHAANRAGRLFDAADVERMRSVREEDEPGPGAPFARIAIASPPSSRPSTATNSSPPHTPPRLSDDESLFANRPDRPESMISIDSRYELDLSFIKTPDGDSEHASGRRAANRDSIASIDSVRTTASAEAVFNPRRRRWSARPGTAAAAGSRYRAPSSSLSDTEEVADFQCDEDDDQDIFDDACSYLEDIEAFPDPPIEPHMTRQRRPSLPESVGSHRSSLRGYSSVPSSPTWACASDAGHASDSLAVKVKYDDCVVAMRISRNTTMADLRERLAAKFQQVQGIALQPNLTICYAPVGSTDLDALPIMLSPGMETRFKQRPTTTATLGGLFARLLPIRSEGDWNAAVASSRGKITLHVLDTELTD